MPTPQNGQTHSNDLSATADKLFECVLPFSGVARKGLKIKLFPFTSNYSVPKVADEKALK